jgi:hypothetical protein
LQKNISIFFHNNQKLKSPQKTQGAEPHVIPQPTAQPLHVLNKKGKGYFCRTIYFSDNGAKTPQYRESRNE